jgi:cellulase/cellobiase CelA1
VAAGHPTPTPTPTHSQPPSPTPAPTGGAGACSVAYSLVNSWSGGFQAQAVIENTGSSAVNGWSLGWTFGGDQKISSLWNGTYTQSGQAVTVANASYDGSIPAGGTATVGFTATGASNPSPAAFTLDGHACS